MNNDGISAYRQANVVTADPKRLVIMCYDGAISELMAAKEFYRSREFEEKAKSLQKALDIIYELLSALDFEKGGEVARNLEALYNFMIRRLIEADLKKDIEAFEDTIRMLEELRAAWQDIFYGPGRHQIEAAYAMTPPEEKRAASSA
jgi:flagellar protein FliS